MKVSKRVLAVFSAACIAASMSVPAFAASKPMESMNVKEEYRVNDDEYLYENEPFEGNKITFSTTAEKPYFRVAINNTSSYQIVAVIYKLVDGKEERYTSFTTEAGEWGSTDVKYLADQDFVIRMSSPEGHLPSGRITVRISAKDFLRVE